MAAFGTAFGTAAHNPNKDVEVPSPPSDGVSSLKFSPASNLLVATSWSGQALCWDVQSNGQAIPKAAITLDKPVLCSAWSMDGTTVFAGEWADRSIGRACRRPAAAACVAAACSRAVLRSSRPAHLVCTPSTCRRLRQRREDVEPADQPAAAGGAARGARAPLLLHPPNEHAGDGQLGQNRQGEHP